MSEQDKIIDRIKKLLRLADVKRGATPEEAANAAAKAQALLFEHNLSMASLGDLGKEERPEEIEQQNADLSNATYQTVKWHRALVFAISKPLFCRVVCWSGEQRVSIIGKPSNIQVVNYLYFYLSTEIEKMATAYQRVWRLKERREKYNNISPNESAKHKISFAMGCVMTIKQKLEEMYAQQVRASEDSHALVVISDQALNDAVHKFHGKTRPMPSRDVYHQSLQAGAEAGKSISIHRGVTNGSVQRKELDHATT